MSTERIRIFLSILLSLLTGGSFFSGMLGLLPAQWETGSIRGLRAGTDAEAALEWTADTVTVTVTSDRAQTINIGVSGGDERAVDFAAGETKTVTMARPGR